MRRHILFVRALSFLFVLQTVPARAQTTAAGPYLATPAWDQKLQCDTLTTCPRFVVLSNWNSEAVLDRETGLVWERSPSTTLVRYFDATRHCSQDTKAGNRMGWRLPSLHELTSLIDPTASFLPAGHPFSDVQSSAYWSATRTLDTGPFFAYAAALNGSNSVFAASINGPIVDRLLVWCVRGGQGVDVQ